jgi:hypothetical protein
MERLYTSRAPSWVQQIHSVYSVLVEVLVEVAATETALILCSRRAHIGLCSPTPFFLFSIASARSRRLRHLDTQLPTIRLGYLR